MKAVKAALLLTHIGITVAPMCENVRAQQEESTDLVTPFMLREPDMDKHTP